jgi:hypothetical protein
MRAIDQPVVMLPITPAEFERLVEQVFELVQHDRAAAQIDVVALLRKPLTAAETSQVRQLVALYFAEVATQAIEEQVVPRPLPPIPMQQWLQQHLRPAA